MSADWFTTASGRKVVLEQLTLERFALGVIEGRPDIIRRRTLEALPERMRKRFPARAGMFILAPPPAIEQQCPDYVLAAALHCYEPVGADAQCSALVVVWFANDVPTDLPAAIGDVVKHVTWETHAVDGWY